MNEKSDRRAIGHDPFADMEDDGWEQPAAEEVAPAEEEEAEVAKEPAQVEDASLVASTSSPEMEAAAIAGAAAEPASAQEEDETASFTEVTLLDWLFSDAAHPDASYPRLRDFPTSQEAAKLLHDWLHS